MEYYLTYSIVGEKVQVSSLNPCSNGMLSDLTDTAKLIRWSRLNPCSNRKTNTQSQRAEGSFYLLANVGNKSGKRKICGFL